MKDFSEHQKTCQWMRAKPSKYAKSELKHFSWTLVELHIVKVLEVSLLLEMVSGMSALDLPGLYPFEVMRNMNYQKLKVLVRVCSTLSFKRMGHGDAIVKALVADAEATREKNHKDKIKVVLSVLPRRILPFLVG